MSYLHSRGILHRNINSSNIFVDNLGGFSFSTFIRDNEKESDLISNKTCKDEKFTKAKKIILKYLRILVMCYVYFIVFFYL